MVRNILFVTKDLGGFRAVHPIAEVLKKQHQVSVVAEGLSLEEWRNVGYDPDPFPETLPRADLVVITAGHPINLEAKLSDSYRNMGVPQVWVEDVWGTSSRLPGPGPELLITLDACGAALARCDERYAPSRILEVGNASVNQFTVPKEVLAEVEALRETYGKLVLFCGQSWDTVDMLGVLFASLIFVDEPYALIPRWHPKRIVEGGHSVIWPMMTDLFEASASGYLLNLDHIKSTDALAACCDVVVSGSSTVLLYAAKFGRATVSISTKATKAALGAQVPYVRWPGLEAGLALELNEPVPNLLELVEERGPALRARQRDYFSKPLLTPSDVAAEILRVLD